MPLDPEALAMLDDTPLNTATAPVPAATGMVGGAFDAAKRNERTLALWTPSRRSADMDLMPVKPELDARARDVLRNDAYVRGGAVIHQDNIVGALYALNAKPAGERLLGPGFDDAWAEEFQQEVEERFTLWAESPSNWTDAARINTLTEMVRLAVGVHVASGEVLATAEWIRGGGRPYSTAIQMIDVDRLSTPPDRTWDQRIVGGVEKDVFGAPFQYHIRSAHPSDWTRSPLNMTWRAVRVRRPWGRLQVIHIFEQMRPEQSRGVAEMVSALKEMRITKQFRDIVLQNAVVNATYAATIESELPPAEAYMTLGGGDNPLAGFQAYLGGYLGQLAEYSGNAQNLTLDGVRIPHLFPGTKLNLHPAGQGGPLGQEFEQSLLRYIAASLGVSYEQLARDYSNTNYSSARAAMAETGKRMAAVKRMVADRFASSVYRLWLEEALNKGLILSLPASAQSPDWLYEDPSRLDAISRCDWIGANKGQIDELKETQAAVLRLRYNLSTAEHEIARFGMDWRQVKRQRAIEARMDEALNIVPDPKDNMMNAASGSAREAAERREE